MTLTNETMRHASVMPPLPPNKPPTQQNDNDSAASAVAASKTEATDALVDSDDTTSQSRSFWRKTIFQPWSDKPAWYRASKPPVRSIWSIYTVLWALYGLLHLDQIRWIPVPRYWGSTRRRTKENYAFIYEHEGKSMGIFSTISYKGGALKTTVLTWMAAAFAFYTNGITVIFDADSGALESAAKRLEARENPDMDHLTAKNSAELIMYGNWIPDYQEIHNFALRSKESGAYVLSMKGVTNWSDRSMRKILLGHKRACGSLFVDTGPGEKESNTPGVVNVSTVVIVTGIYKNVSTDDAVSVTLDAKKYNLRDSSKHVLVAIGAVGWRHFNRRTQYELAEQFGVEPEQVILLPDHKRILKGETVRLQKISKKFLYAISVLNRVRVEAAIEYNRTHAMTFPRKQSPLTIREQGEAAADRLLSLTAGDVDRACEFVYRFATEKNSKG